MSRREFSVCDSRCIETLDDDFSTDESFDRKRRKTVETKAKSSQDDHDVAIVSWEIVEDVAFCGLAKDQIARQCHDHACKTRYAGGDVCHCGKSVDCWPSETAIDQERIVVADKGEGDDRYRFEGVPIENDCFRRGLTSM